MRTDRVFRAGSDNWIKAVCRLEDLIAVWKVEMTLLSWMRSDATSANSIADLSRLG